MLDILAHLASTLFGRVEDPLTQQPVRARLLRLIEDRPGLHASSLCRESGQPWGTVQYHLSLLEKADLVSTVETGRERHFFPPGTDARRARLLAVLGHGRRADVATFVREHPGCRQVDICEGTQLSRKTFRQNMPELLAEGLVQERLGAQSNRYYPGPELETVLSREP